MRFAVFALVVLSVSRAFARGPHTSVEGPWWVVAGSFANADNSNFQATAVSKASAAVRRCGLEPFNDFSMKFYGFRPGYDVVVVGGYNSRDDANAALAILRPCVPSAFIKAGRHLGE
ncbi:SPOR domain-containing protein [Methylobacterium sp. WL6]|uniref:SPOR domain-containing protein n=1 Tax=Methylobacterium sp. WL6 TaxID=2603901 RepID=UPI0011CC6D76|nr:SPOR domain-containing protein [Methylobacterium sp. WL6]TXN72707.1 SPOR domain-containing protein [Methylobacterium sp. WL6]